MAPRWSGRGAPPTTVTPVAYRLGNRLPRPADRDLIGDRTMIDERRLAEELAARHGVTSRRRLRELGLSPGQIDRLIRDGRLLATGNGVLRAPSVPSTLLQRCAVACAVTGGVIAFPTAGQLWELRRTPSVAAIHVVVPWERRVAPPHGVVVRRSRQLPDRDFVRRPDGIDVTSPPRTVFDAAALLSHHDLQSMIEDALYRRLFVPRTLIRLAERLGHPCREGSRLIAQVLAARDLAAPPVASEYELRLERAMLARGFPSLTRQHPVEIAPGHWIHPDLGVPEHRFFVEVDHRRWHDSSEDRSYDAWRDRRLRLMGCWVERVSDLAIDHQLAATVEDLWAAWTRVASRHAASA